MNWAPGLRCAVRQAAEEPEEAGHTGRPQREEVSAPPTSQLVLNLCTPFRISASGMEAQISRVGLSRSFKPFTLSSHSLWACLLGNSASLEVEGGC